MFQRHLLHVVICCCLLLSLSLTGIHPTTISESFEKAAAKAVEILTTMATPVALSDRESLLKSAMTSLSSKVRGGGDVKLSLRVCAIYSGFCTMKQLGVFQLSASQYFDSWLCK